MLYMPISWQGVFVTSFAIAFMIYTLVMADKRVDLTNKIFYGIFPYWAPTFLLWIWIAEKTCDSTSHEATRDEEDESEDNPTSFEASRVERDKRQFF